MSTRQYSACRLAVADKGQPPVSFLDDLIDGIKPLPDDVFEPNHNADIYGVLAPVLGPWTGTPHRKAAMCEALRVIAAFESGWNFNEGRDLSAGPETLMQQETGVFQVSADSMAIDPSLRACVNRVAGSSSPQTFIAAMKVNHPLAIEYCARLLRFSTRWDGPINRGWVAKYVTRASVAEFQRFLV